MFKHHCFKATASTKDGIQFTLLHLGLWWLLTASTNLILTAISKAFQCLQLTPPAGPPAQLHSSPPEPGCSLRGHFLCIKGFFKSDTSASVIIYSKSIFRNQFKISFLSKAFTSFPGYMASSNKTGHGSNLTCITMLVVAVFISISSKTVLFLKDRGQVHLSLSS